MCGNNEGAHGSCGESCGHQQDGCCGGSCDGGGHGFTRKFCSRQEQIECLEGYLAELQAESTAVQERIADLRKG